MPPKRLHCSVVYNLFIDLDLQKLSTKVQRELSYNMLTLAEGALVLHVCSVTSFCSLNRIIELPDKVSKDVQRSPKD